MGQRAAVRFRPQWRRRNSVLGSFDVVKIGARLERAVVGALRSAIAAHGPITAAHIGSAVKRVLGNLANAGVRIVDSVLE